MRLVKALGKKKKKKGSTGRRSRQAQGRSERIGLWHTRLAEEKQAAWEEVVDEATELQPPVKAAPSELLGKLGPKVFVAEEQSLVQPTLTTRVPDFHRKAPKFQ